MQTVQITAICISTTARNNTKTWTQKEGQKLSKNFCLKIESVLCFVKGSVAEVLM